MKKFSCWNETIKPYFFYRFQSIDDIDTNTNESFFESASVISQSCSDNNGARTGQPRTKKRKTTYDDDRNEFIESIRSPNRHERFGTYVSASLAQIDDEHLIKRTKCQIQLVLTKALTEYAEKMLASTESLVNGNVDMQNDTADTDEFQLTEIDILPKCEPLSPTHCTFEN